MGHTGYIDWTRLSRSFTDTRYGNTFVCAYWLVDYGRNRFDHGVSLLKGEGLHPDWFVHAERADLTLRATVGLNVTASPNVSEVFDTDQCSTPAGSRSRCWPACCSATVTPATPGTATTGGALRRT